MKPVLLVSGPTASGKSDLAIRLAECLDGEIVNIDSVQVYKGLDIGSAKATPADQARVPHHMLDLQAPCEPFNASDFIRGAWRCIEEIQGRYRTAVLCGGSSMYVTLLFHGLAGLPAADAVLRARLMKRSTEDLYRDLCEADPEAASRIHPHDRIRIERALEAFEMSGMCASELRAEHQFRESPVKGLFIVLCWPRELLYARIDGRSKRMFDEGLLEETQRIVSAYGENLFPLGAIGYAQALAVARGRMTIAEGIASLQQETRNFSKRQNTFWRNEPGKRGWEIRPRATEPSLLLKSSDDFYITHKNVRDFSVLDLSYDELTTEVRRRLTEAFDSNEVWYVNAAKLLAS